MSFEERPIDRTPIETDELPDTPVRDRNIVAGAWTQAPGSLVHLGDDLPGHPEAHYKRRIGRFLLWRSGPASKGHARYLAIDSDDLGHTYEFRLNPDEGGRGVGPSGATHERFRTWKEDLLGRTRAHTDVADAAPDRRHADHS